VRCSSVWKLKTRSCEGVRKGLQRAVDTYRTRANGRGSSSEREALDLPENVPGVGRISEGSRANFEAAVLSRLELLLSEQRTLAGLSQAFHGARSVTSEDQNEAHDLRKRKCTQSPVPDHRPRDARSRPERPRPSARAAIQQKTGPID
jgi:hypothetical protein